MVISEDDEFRLTPVSGRPGLPISLRIDPALEKRLRAAAKAQKVTITSIVEYCLVKGLPSLEGK